MLPFPTMVCYSVEEMAKLQKHAEWLQDCEKMIASPHTASVRPEAVEAWRCVVEGENCWATCFAIFVCVGLARGSQQLVSPGRLLAG